MGVYILFLFVLVCANCYQWNGIEIMKAKLSGYKSASDQMSKHARDHLERLSDEADGFITNLGNISMVEAVLQLPEDDVCKESFTSLQELKNAYKVYLSNSQRDLMNWLSDIERKFSQANSEVFSYQSIADGRMFYDNLTMSNSTEKINLWLEDKLNSLKCRLITRCSEHVVSNRSPSDVCDEDDFYCPRNNNSDKCLRGPFVCDGNCDCSGCDDEPVGCTQHCFRGFHCENLRCIKKQNICNGIDDCGDGSDEEGCPEKGSVKTGLFQRNNRTYIRLGKANPCSQSQFYCPRANKCINRSFVCDRGCDCSPCDDEADECTRYCYGGFHCNNLRCIKKDRKCNGIDDCGDGSDEEGCPTKCSVETDTFSCDIGTCIGLGKVCDGKNDCDDGSDEGGLCGQTSCGNFCSPNDGICLGTPRGSVCLSHCPFGTSETSAGCLPGPKQSPTIFEMLEDFPRLMIRYQALNKWLQKKTFDELANSTLEVLKCKGGVYDSLNNIILLDSLNNSATYWPHWPQLHRI